MVALALDSDGHVVFRQYLVDDIRPFHSYDSIRITQEFGQLSRDDARVAQPVKIEVVEPLSISMIFVGDGEAGARNPIGAAHARRQPAHEGGLATTKVAS